MKHESKAAPANDFGTRLRELRKSAGMTMREFAQHIGYNESYISRLESGKATAPSARFFGVVCERMGIDASCFNRSLKTESVSNHLGNPGILPAKAQDSPWKLTDTEARLAADFLTARPDFSPLTGFKVILGVVENDKLAPDDKLLTVKLIARVWMAAMEAKATNPS